jgi:hypothetical protein
MDSHSVHHPEKILLFFSLPTPLRGEGRKFIGNDPDPPSFTVCRTPASIGQGLMRSERLIALTEGAVFFIGRFFGRRFSLFKIVGSLRTLCGNDHPLFRCGILSELRHRDLLQNLLRFTFPSLSMMEAGVKDFDLISYHISIGKRTLGT